MSRDEKTGKVDGLSAIMGQSVGEEKAAFKLIDSEDALPGLRERIKELLRKAAKDKPTGFEDILQLMGKPKPGKEGMVTLSDFEALIKAAGGSTELSAHEIKSVFRSHAIEPPARNSALALGKEPYIPLTGHAGHNFKDVFLPSSVHLWGEPMAEAASSNRPPQFAAAASESSRTASMLPD